MKIGTTDASRDLRKHCSFMQENYIILSQNVFNTLWPSDSIWQHRSGPTLTQVMICWLDSTKLLPDIMLTYDQ